MERTSRGTPHHVLGADGSGGAERPRRAPPPGRRITARPGENGCGYTGFYYDTARAHTVEISYKEKGMLGICFLRASTPHLREASCLLVSVFSAPRHGGRGRSRDRLQDAAALDPVPACCAAAPVVAAVAGRAASRSRGRARLPANRARLRRVARRGSGRWHHDYRHGFSGGRRRASGSASGGASGRHQYLNTCADAGARSEKPIVMAADMPLRVILSSGITNESGLKSMPSSTNP